MLGKCVLLVTTDKAGARRIMGCLRATGNEVIRVAETHAAIELIEARAVDLVLLDHRNAPEIGPILRTAAERTPVVVLTSEPRPEEMLDLVCQNGTHHVIARCGDSEVPPLRSIDRKEVLVTVEKILRGDLFGLDKYVSGFGIEPGRFQLRQASDRDELIECVQDYLRWIGAPRELRNGMALVADELATNAIYNAPCDDHGRPRYAAVDRRCKIALDPWEFASVEFASDGETFAISVTDYFGSLSPARIRDGLQRCLSSGDQIEQKDGGAGLGLYTVLAACDQLVFNIDPGERTEVIAIANLNKRGQERSRSLHVFVNGVEHAVELDRLVEEAASSSVMLSHSMVIDLRETLGQSGNQSVVPLTRRKTTERAITSPWGDDEYTIEVLQH
jgi:hypothetical protein